MNRLLILLLLPAFFGMSCSKGKKINYTLGAVYDSTIATNNQVIVTVTKVGGDDDLVNLSVAGLPDYMTADISPLSGNPPYTAVITFKLSYYAERNVSNWTNYKITVNGLSGSSVTRTCDVTFLYTPADAAVAFDGHTFYSAEQCSMSGNNGWSVPMISQGPNQLTLVGFYSNFTTTFDVPAVVNGKNRTITIPQYTVSGYTFRGTGTFYAVGGDSVGCSIHFSRTTLGSFDTCTTIITEVY